MSFATTIPETGAWVHPCLSCGACCAHFRASFYWAEADDQTPGGVPVATVAINNAKNAGILAAQILGASDVAIRSRVAAYKESMRAMVETKAAKIEQQYRG